MKTRRHLSPAGILVILGVILVVSILLSLMSDVVRTLMGEEISKQITQVVFLVRLPRIFASVLVGGALAVSGAAYQGMFKNPLVSPDLLGASAGASFGAVLGIVLSVGAVGVKSSAFCFGLLAVLITWIIGTRIGKGSNLTFLLVLGGILVSGLFQSLVTVMKYTADTDDTLPEITFWLMGSMNRATYSDVLGMLAPFGVCLVLMIAVSGKINILALGEDEAKSLGVNTRHTIIGRDSYSISITGTISWVGLIVPHLVRMMMGPNFKYLIPGSMLLGGSYLLLMDDLCRSLLAVEFPLGIATSLVGIPFFIFLMAKRESSW